MTDRHAIVILGIFVADTAFRAPRQPAMGETLLGSGFALGPGGKGSNQAVAAARAGGEVHFISRLGTDHFGEMALEVWRDAGVRPAITRHAESYTGAACIFLDEASGENAIIVCPGIAGTICADDIEAQADLIRGAGVVVAQLEQPVAAAHHLLRLGREGGARTILNPAPATTLPEGMLALCDLVTPNESEAAALTGLPVHDPASAEAAAAALRERGAGAVVVTLGAGGALYHDGAVTVHVPAVSVGAVVETTGAGDAFNGALAAALAEGMDPVAAVGFGNAAAGLSVTRPGAARAMPTRAEIDALLGPL